MSLRLSGTSSSCGLQSGGEAPGSIYQATSLGAGSLSGCDCLSSYTIPFGLDECSLLRCLTLQGLKAALQQQLLQVCSSPLQVRFERLVVDAMAFCDPSKVFRGIIEQMDLPTANRLDLLACDDPDNLRPAHGTLLQPKAA